MNSANIEGGGAPSGQGQADPSGRRQKRSPLAAIGAGLVAVMAKFKFLLVFLKSGGTMLIAMWVYALFFGWRFAAGFVLLIFVHECGHLLAARWFGLKVGAPVFLPFMGAIIALKEAPRDAWVEAVVGIGGPVLGAIGAFVCLGVYFFTDDLLFRALAYTGFWLNLFNLTPILPLDGGRISSAISPWLWVAGVAVLSAVLPYHFNLFVLLIVLLSVPRVWRTLRHPTVRNAEYYQVAPLRRWTMSVLYFGLAALLGLGMYSARFSVHPAAPEQAASL